MYTKEQIREGLIEIERTFLNMKVKLYGRTDIDPYKDRMGGEKEIKAASEDLENLRDTLAFL